MFVKRLIQKAKNLPEVPIPTETLGEGQLHPRLTVHHGLPGTASILAFDPLQRLLAVASLDGRIKIFGSPGVEGLLQSPMRAPCKFLEFNSSGQLVHVTADNDIEMWDLGKQELACSLKWESDISALSVIPGTPFMYVGDDVGTVSVVQFGEQQQQFTHVPYGIPAHVTLGGIVRAGSSTAPSVVRILPQPGALYSRLIIAYANGLMTLWDLHEKKVLAVRGGTRKQRETLAEHAASLQEQTFTEKLVEQAAGFSEQLHFSPPKATIPNEVDEEEEKEICTVCWACVDTLVAGYVDGDVWLWTFPPVSKDKIESKCHYSSGTPLRKLDLAHGKSTRMPVIVLRWSSTAKTCKNGGGRLYVFGGGGVGLPQALTVLSWKGEASDAKLQRLELLLHGPFADVSLVPSTGGTQMAALLVLTSPGQLYVYDEAGMASCFSMQNGGATSSSLQPVSWPPVPDATAAKLVPLPNDAAAASILFQTPCSSTAIVPPVLPAGTKWPITGGIPSSVCSSSRSLIERSVLVRGLQKGSVQLWNTSTPSLQLICGIENQSTNASSISALDFCADSGLLAVGNEQGEVWLHALSADAHKGSCQFINSIENPKGTESREKAIAGFQCVVALTVHKATIQTIVIASGFQRLAVGDASGMISLLDLATRTLVFLTDAFETKTKSSILSLAFSTASISEEGVSPSSPSSSFGSKKKLHTSSISTTILYAANKEGSVVAMEGSMGRGVLSPGPVNLKNPSTALSMYLLDAFGSPLTTISNKETKNANGDFPFPIGAGSEATFMLLCLEHSLRLYSTSAVTQGLRKTLRKAKLREPCLNAFPFESASTRACGLFLLFSSGHIELRSLPDLAIVQETALSTLVKWQLVPTVSSLRTFVWTRNGRIALVDEGREHVEFSLLAEENDLRLPASLPSLFDKDLATASEVATFNAPTYTPKKKSLIGVMKDIKSANEQAPTVHPSSELHRLFSSRPFTMISSDIRSKGSAESESSGLEIDDLDIDEMEPSSPRTSMSRKEKLVKKLKRGFKGKEKSNDADTRAQLFEEQQNDETPHVRTTESIKAAYGHKPSGDTTSVAAMSKDKLIERQEKLQAINKRAEEMEVGSENFASLAEDLAKKMDNKKWEAVTQNRHAPPFVLSRSNDVQ